MDVETLVITACSPSLKVQLYHSIPSQRPAEFGTVVRMGGNMTGYVVDRALVTVRLYAQTRDRASELASAMKDLLQGMTDTEPNVFDVDILSDYLSYDLDAMVASHTINCQIIYNN